MSLFRQKALDKLRSPEQLDELMTVASPRSWLVLVAFLGILLTGLLWGIFATVQTSVSGNGILTTRNPEGVLEAVLYISIEDGQRVQPGMAVKIAPTTVRQEEYGLLVAEVSAVRRSPSTLEEMIAVLGNDALAQSLASAGAIIEVKAQLTPDTTPTGYRWTSAGGPPAITLDETVCMGIVVIREQRPIELVFANFVGD